MNKQEQGLARKEPATMLGRRRRKEKEEEKRRRKEEKNADCVMNGSLKIDCLYTHGAQPTGKQPASSIVSDLVFTNL